MYLGFAKYSFVHPYYDIAKEVITIETKQLNGNSNADIVIAGKLLKQGKLVAIPTETVYGLAADATNGAAVERIFTAKGRPQDNPLIVHIASYEQLDQLVAEVPTKAKQIMDAFWPGPLTIIMPKSSLVPNQVSAGLPTVAVRFPSHPIASKIIRAAGVPLAAPSANVSGNPSPTTASHVLHDLKGKIAAIVDGGSCQVGLESTVITMATDVPTLLRPGQITLEQLKSVLGTVEVANAVLHQLDENAVAASPGMKYKHYAPKAKLILLDGTYQAFQTYVNAKAQDGVAALCYDGEDTGLLVPAVTYGTEGNLEEQAHQLFSALRKLDEMNCQLVYARCPKAQGVGLAVYNRMIRAAGFEVQSLD